MAGVPKKGSFTRDELVDQPFDLGLIMIAGGPMRRLAAAMLAYDDGSGTGPPEADRDRLHAELLAALLDATSYIATASTMAGPVDQAAGSSSAAAPSS